MNYSSDGQLTRQGMNQNSYNKARLAPRTRVTRVLTENTRTIRLGYHWIGGDRCFCFAPKIKEKIIREMNTSSDNTVAKRTLIQQGLTDTAQFN